MTDIVLSQNQEASGNSTNLSKTSLTTNFNITPYYDDYDPNNQYYKILYKPGYAVQARELTQMQSMLQSQIARFGRHVFKEGSIVLPGAFTIRAATTGTLNEGPGNPIDYVKINTVDASNNTIDVNTYYNQVLKGLNSNISAYVIDVLPSDGTTQNTNTLYVNYLGAQPGNSAVRTFEQGETLFGDNVGTCIVMTSANTSNVIGKSSWFQIEEGVFFAKDHFIYFPTQSVVLDRYGSLPSCKVGFYVSEEIVNYTKDFSLLDPALESSNYSAPGADRFKLLSQLEVVSIDNTIGRPDFVTLFTIKDGYIQTINEDPQYNELGDVIATRTSQESGDYVVRGLNVQVSEHDKVLSPIPNYGRFDEGNNKLLIATVDPGAGYVKGYAVTKHDRTDVTFPKPENFKNVSSQLALTTMGSYLRLNEFVGTWKLDQGTRVYFYDKPQKRISDRGFSIAAQTGNNIGDAIINSVQYISGVPGWDAVYDVYLSDIKMKGSNTFSSVASLYLNQSSPSASLGGDVTGSSLGNTALQEINKSTLLYYVGSNYTRKLKDTLNASQTLYYFYRTDTSGLYFDTTGKTTVTLSGSSNFSLPYGTTVLNGLSDNEVLEDISVTCCESFNIGPLFSSAVVQRYAPTANTLDGISTYFTRFNKGDKIGIGGCANTWQIIDIINNSRMLLDNAVPLHVTGGVTNTIFKIYKTGDIINMAGKGVKAGDQRLIETTDTSLVLYLKEDLPEDIDITVTYKVASKESLEAKKVLKPARVVKINCSTAGTSGPFNLGFSDVYKINKIVKKSSEPTSLTDGDDVTKYFTLDNGQRDTMYDLATIKKSGSLSLTASDWLLISLDYFAPTFSGRTGYFSVDSYPIQDDDSLATSETMRTEAIPIYTSSRSGFAYDLRNHIDFRPVKAITATDTQTVASACTNPTTSSTYTFAAQGMLFPVPSSQLQFDYSYYLGRVDIVTVNKDGIISVTQGVAAANPIVPDILETQMMLAIINIPPYPSLSPAYGNALKRKDLACKIKKASNRVYTMRDIGVLDKRISALEYYTSLTLLEKDALNLKILDDQGLDRFKNGIFVDTFRDHSLSAKGVDIDYRIVVDPVELSIRPLFSTTSLGYEYISGTGVKAHTRMQELPDGSGFIVHKNGIVTLDYTQTIHFSQPRVTDVRLLERGTFFFRGTIQMYPSQDVWVDTSFAPDEIIEIAVDDALIEINVTGPDAINQQGSYTKSLINTTWENWKTTIVGYNLYKGEGASKVFVGFYTSEEAAKQAAAAWTTVQNGGKATLETLYNNTRVGTNYFANASTDTGAGGAKLVSSDIIPYIRQQKIGVQCLNLKGYSKMTVFFDDVNVTEYCTPLTPEQFAAFIAGNSIPPNASGAYPTEGADLIVDDYGALYFIFRIGENPKFRCGQRKMVVVDNTNIDAQIIADTEDTSTSATGIFFAQGTSQTLQKTIYSTKGYLETTEQLSEQYDSFTPQVLPNTWKPPPKGHCCFDPNAKILMANCTLKAIKDIVEGDEVLGNNGKPNKVLKNNIVRVNGRKMMKLKGANFYTTDDHLFLTKKGWKTWRPDVVLESAESIFNVDGKPVVSINNQFLMGDNREEPINLSDHLKVIKVKDSNLIEEYVPYEDVEAEEFTFDPSYEVHDLTLDGTMSYIVDGYVVHNCCVAYSVLIRAPDDEEGIFCTGFDIYVARKSRTRGLWFEIAEMNNSGQVTDSRVPGSQVWYNNAEVPVSNTGADNPCQVRFEYPIFLFNKKAYAFIVHSDSPSPFAIDPDTQIWISRLGQEDKLTKAIVVDRQGTGQFWQTTNNVNWYEVGDVDLKIDIYRAVFTAPSYGIFTIGNLPVERLHLTALTSSIKGKIGEHFGSGDVLTLGSANGTITVGQRLTGNVSGVKANGTIISIPSAGKYLTTNNFYAIGESVAAYNVTTGLYTGVTATVTAIANAQAVLSYVSETASNIYTEWIESTGGFTPNTKIQMIGNAGYNYSANVYRVNDYNYSVMSFEPKVLDFIKTDIKYEVDTYNAGELSPAGYEVVYPSETQYFSNEKVLRSKTNEVSEIGGDYSNKIKVTMSTFSTFVTPVFDVETSHTIYIENLINANTDGETGSSGGQALNKYISQTITLADGQDAEDLKVYLTSYRPPNTDVHVYVKILHASDGDTLKQKNWIELEKEGDGDSTYSSLSDRNNFKEYSYTFPTSMRNATTNIVQYTSSAGILFKGFKYFAVKIVLVADNPAIVPRVADLRCIALQM